MKNEETKPNKRQCPFNLVNGQLVLSLNETKRVQLTRRVTYSWLVCLDYFVLSITSVIV